MKTRHLFVLMALLVAIMVGTFIWFVATWSPEDNPSLTGRDMPLRVGENTHLAIPTLVRPDGNDQRS